MQPAPLWQEDDPSPAPPPVRPAAPPAGGWSAAVAAALWRGDQLGTAISTVWPSGFAALDAQLPGGGWPGHGLTEILCAHSGALEWRLLGPALRHICGAGQSVVLVGPPLSPHLPGLRLQGIDERQLVWVQADTLAERLDNLPMQTLSAVHPHRLTLEHIGCRTLGDLRALPRSGIGRRFDQALLQALDRVYGLAPEVHQWVALPAHFEERLELMARVEQAPALVFGAQRLLRVLSGWLFARRAGVTAFTLHWAHDAMRARSAGEGGEITIRTAAPTRDTTHLCRLLTEHLARVELLAPVGDLRLVATEVQPLHDTSATLLPDTVQQGEALGLVLERLGARLGPQRVLRPVLCEDHRPEWMCRWQNAAAPLPRKGAPGPDLPQPGFLLPEPLRLLMQGEHPVFHGPLMLLAGPQRVEGGWWDRVEGAGRMRNVVRDYWVALSAQVGVVWVFQTRLNDAPAWYLHGRFA